MKRINLNGAWKMRSTDTDEWIGVTVPGSVFNDLLQNKKIEDPFYRDNEKYAYEIASKDYQYSRKVKVEQDFLEQERIFLLCEGLDTLAEITINDHVIARTNNMHRTYEIDVKNILHLGENTITITLLSPVHYIKKLDEERPLWGVVDAIKGYPHIRKAHYMFGWDWGPKIPDSGIWRDISFVSYNEARLEDIYFTQVHHENLVELKTRIRLEKWLKGEVDVKVELTCPKGKTQMLSMTTDQLEENIIFDIEEPELWWPNGYGKQPLYGLSVTVQSNGQALDVQTFEIGLRTIKVRQEPDQWGKTFEFEVNGLSIFSMGANYIPEDNLISRGSREKTERLIQDCIEANFNMIRVWGGGYYPNKDFYELCDRYGLIVWQDFMFACGVYELTNEFTENIKKEIADNIKRLRHHASLALWCGNNEMEEAWVHWDFPKTAKLRTDYLKQFEIIFPEIVKELDPETFYWVSSPSSGGGFDKPNSENEGDVHYWDVWHGLKPFTEYRKFHFRFCSEFGFQSFPSIKTIDSFTLPEDRNIFSNVMENHQKNGEANGKILNYLSQTFLYPKDFKSLLYTSQILQAEAIKYGVEHWRRNRGRCMGSIYWQLNDCWPVASWSSIDNFGRWKALHYFAKKFYAPVLLSLCEEGTNVEIHLTNDKAVDVTCQVDWKLRTNSTEVIKEGTVQSTVEKLSAKKLESLSFNELTDEKKRDVFRFHK